VTLKWLDPKQLYNGFVIRGAIKFQVFFQSFTILGFSSLNYQIPGFSTISGFLATLNNATWAKKNLCIYYFSVHKKFWGKNLFLFTQNQS